MAGKHKKSSANNGSKSTPSSPVSGRRNMFDLEHAVADWRQQMAESGVSQSQILDELESHLREEFESRLASGLQDRHAFDAAVRTIGHAEVLKHEFAKTVTVGESLKQVLFAFAGIPNHNLATNMNTTHTEPAWATYLKAAAFLLPALILTTLSAIWVVPKLQQICANAALPEAAAGAFWNLTHSSIQFMLLVLDQGLIILGSVALLLCLCEWRFRGWARYRRATIGFGTFVINTLVLLALFMMFLAAIVAAPGMAHLK
jgi:hypothetical protein